MLALIGNLGVGETVILVVVLVVVFGGRLPSVARDAMRLVARLRRTFDDLRREIDLDGEFRTVRQDLERTVESPRRIPTPPRRTVPRGSSETAGPPADPDPAPAAEDRDADTPDSRSDPARETGS